MLSIYDSPNAVSANRLFQLSGKQVAYSQHQFNRVQKSARYLQLLFFSEEMSHRSVLELEIQGFC